MTNSTSNWSFPLKLANSVVGDHGIGQFQEMANPVQQLEGVQGNSSELIM
jgi:hypothetical protein